MALEFLSGLLEFVLRHKLVIGFYALVALLIYRFRKNFTFQARIIAICRTKIGLGMMDRIASRHRELVKLFGYIGIGAGFLCMFAIMFILASSVLTLIQRPDSPAQIAPVIPGVQIPGTPRGLSPPFVEGIIAIFIIAVVHEFAHGVVARAHNVAVKSSGPAIVGPIFAAFVEPDEGQLKKKDDVVNYSIFAAGTFSNLVLAMLVFIVMSFVTAPLGGLILEKDGALISKVVPGAPASAAGMPPGIVVGSVNSQPILSKEDLVLALSESKPNDTVVFGNGTAQFTVVAAVHPSVSGRGYFGIEIEQGFNTRTPAFKVFSWVEGLLMWIAVLSLGIGVANMIPVGPLDGGKMLHLALTKVRGEQRANKAFIRFSILMLFVILFLLSPIFKAVIKSVAGIF